MKTSPTAAKMPPGGAAPRTGGVPAVVSAVLPPATAGYAHRTNKAAVVELYDPTLPPAAPSPAGGAPPAAAASSDVPTDISRDARRYVPLTLAELHALGFRPTGDIRTLHKHLGRLYPNPSPNIAPDVVRSYAPDPLSLTDRLPLVCPSVEAWAQLTGLRVANGLCGARNAQWNRLLSHAAPTAESSGGQTMHGGTPILPLEQQEPHVPRDHNLGGPFRWMNASLRERADAEEDRLKSMGAVLCDSFGLEPVEFGRLSTEPVVYIGRIMSEPNEQHEMGKLTSEGVWLEGWPGETAHFHPTGKVLLDLRHTPAFSFFPGQVVAVFGMPVPAPGLDYCARFVVQKAFTGAVPPPLALPAANARALADAHSAQNSGPLRVWAANGPFCLHSDLDYTPLGDLQAAVAEASARGQGPDVLVLCGPFVEAEHPAVKKGETFVLDRFLPKRALLAGVLQEVDALLEDLPALEIVLLPSVLDATASPVLPQWPLQQEDLDAIVDPGRRKRVTVVSNPSCFVIGGVVFGATSTDVLFHLNAEQTDRRAPGQLIEPIPRLALHLLEQRSFYPLCPCPRPEEAPVELPQHFHLEFDVAPDVLLVPSKLKLFAKPIGSTLVVNAGTLCKAATGGTYAKITIKPQRREQIQIRKSFLTRSISLLLVGCVVCSHFHTFVYSSSLCVCADTSGGGFDADGDADMNGQAKVQWATLDVPERTRVEIVRV
jgi:hypothetical protein